MDSQSFTAELIEASPLPLCFREVGVRASQEDMEGRVRGVFMGLVSFKLESCLLGQATDSGRWPGSINTWHYLRHSPSLRYSHLVT